MNGQISRRTMLRSAGVFGLAVTAGKVRAQSDAKAGAQGNRSGRPYFGSGAFELLTPESLKPNAYTTNVSQDGLAFTILFGSANVDSLHVEAGGGTPASGVKTAVLRIPFMLPAGKRLAGFTQDIRGYVNKTKGARAVVVADLGGSTQVFDFPHADEPESRDFVRSFLSMDRRQSEKDASSVYTINFVLTAQCQTAEDSVLLAIDSLDVEAVLYAVDAPKRTPTPAKKRVKK